MIKIGTDCSGIGAPEAALKNLGIKHRQVFACEIDQHARKSFVAVHGQPETFYEDLTARNHEEVEKLDLCVAGFPCQAFSIAGKRKGFEDIRGSVFFHVAEFIRVNQPESFILENVKGLISHDNGRTFQTIIDVLSGQGTCNGQISIPFYDDGLDYHIFWQVLNTKEHGIPQNRERIFIVGFKKPRSFSFPLPEVLSLKLKDLLEGNVADKYFLSEKLIENILNQTPKDDLIQIKSATKRGRVGDQCAQTLEVENMQGFCVPVLTPSRKEKRQNGRRFKEDGDPSFTLTAQDQHGISNGKTIRRLTPRECWRLQNFSDTDFDKAATVQSDTQLYKQAGNSMTVRVIEKILKRIYEA